MVKRHLAGDALWNRIERAVKKAKDRLERVTESRDATDVVFAGEKVRPEYAEPVPTLESAERPRGFATLPLEDLVRMKLTSFRDKDRVHARDMIELGILDETWPSRFATELADRLQELIDDPDG